MKIIIWYNVPLTALNKDSLQIYTYKNEGQQVQQHVAVKRN